MTEAPVRHTFGRVEIALFLVCFALAVVVANHVTREASVFSREAVIRAGIGEDLLMGRGRGRQGLVGSLGYGPLPTLLPLPILQLPAPAGGEWAFVWAAAAAAAFLAASVCAWLGACGVSGPLRAVCGLAVMASPPILGGVVHGTGDPLFLAIAFGIFCLLAHWLETDHLRSLAYLAVAAALAPLARVEGLLLQGLALLFVLGHLAWRRRARGYAEAALIVFLTPMVYVTALWIVMNRVIMGEPFFFARGLLRAAQAGGLLETLAGEGRLWAVAAALGAVVLAGVAAARLTHPAARRWMGLAALLPILLAFWAAGRGGMDLPRAPSDAELPRVIAEVRDGFRPDVLVVCGYRGYDVRRLLPEDHGPQLYHTLSFYPEIMLPETRGKRAYLLVPAPEGADRWEDIHLKYPGIFDAPTPFTVYERTWRHWRLWRIVRLDPSDRR